MNLKDRFLKFWKIGKKQSFKNIRKIWSRQMNGGRDVNKFGVTQMAYYYPWTPPLNKKGSNVHTWLNSECPTSTTRLFARTAEILSHMTSTSSTWETFMPTPMIPVTGIGERFTLMRRDPIKSTQGPSLSMIQTEIYKCEFDVTVKGSNGSIWL